MKKPAAPAAAPADDAGTKGVIFRLTRADWLVAKELSARTETSMQALLEEGLNHVLRQHKMKPIVGMPRKR